MQVQPSEQKDDSEAESPTPVARPSTVELIPGGANIPVNNHNRVDFVEKYMRYILHGSVKKQVRGVRQENCIFRVNRYWLYLTTN